MTKPDLLPDDLKYWWADDEEGPYNGPFDSRDIAIDDAYCHRATCFDDPSQKDGLYLLHGKNYPNPEYSPEYPKDWYENAPENITGKPVYVMASDITDEFHKAWNTRTPNKSAEVDLDAVKKSCDEYFRSAMQEPGLVLNFDGLIGHLHASGQLATGKGGDDPYKQEHKPCGCVTCVCEDEFKCRGCGAKNCDSYPACKSEKVAPSPALILSIAAASTEQQKTAEPCGDGHSDIYHNCNFAKTKNGQIVVVHPDFPAHLWDGKKMVRIEVRPPVTCAEVGHCYDPDGPKYQVCMRCGEPN